MNFLILAIGLAVGVCFTGYFMSAAHEAEMRRVEKYINKYVANCSCCIFKEDCYNGYDRDDDCFVWDGRLDE